jgi:hypothetical protein
MRYTRSQARARAAEEAQASLLQLATAPCISITPTHTGLTLEANVPTLL